MREDVKNIFAKHGITVTLKGYKEMPSRDGYHMRGSLYVNNKRAIFFEDEGRGGECTLDILNKDNAKPLMDIKDELSKLKAYPGDETIGDSEYRLTNLFVEMAEDHLYEKVLKKTAKKSALVRYENQDYDNNTHTRFNDQMDKMLLNHLISRLNKRKEKTIQIWNFEQKWVTYTPKALKNILKELE